MIVVEIGFTGIDYPLDHPRVGWRTMPGDIDFSSEAEGFDAAFAALPQTSSAWRPTSVPATWAIASDPDVETVSYFGISGHDLGTLGCAVEFQIWDGSGWETVASHSPPDDEPIMALINPRDTTAARINITGGSGVPTISNIRIGRVMEWQRKATYTGTPITDARDIVYRDNDSQTGEWLGRTVLRRGRPFSVEVQHLSEDWIAAEYEAFRDFCDAGDGTFYIAPRPTLAREVAYARPASPVAAPRALPNSKISRDVTLDLWGLSRG